MKKEERYNVGLEAINGLTPGVGEAVMQQLQSIAPDLHKLAVEYFGDFYTRDEIDPKTRVLTTISAATAAGNAPGILEFHVHAALNMDCSMKEIVEIISHTTLFIGFPGVMTALKIAKKVFIARGLMEDDGLLDL